ncbi:MAG TPA: M90 family metallopeptidase [Gammaproteobacteria bacterium]|nr:M90 family metallopeptidase [Gammaproteobacteria bacterium]
MWHPLRRWWRRRTLRRHPIPDALWNAARAELEVLRRLDAPELSRLRALTTWFVRDKAIYGAGGFAVDDGMRVAIAAQACVPILNLDLDYYDNWYSIIVYADTFVAERDEVDGIGIVHRTRHALSGESWQRGPMVLAWGDVRPGPPPYGEASNVVVHECAHKLDMIDGAANGLPPLHRDMDVAAWSRALSQAYAQLQRDLNERGEGALDAYAAHSPAEFFAVATEAFFMTPDALARSLPEVYEQLALYFRQDPRRRMSADYPGRAHSGT